MDNRIIRCSRTIPTSPHIAKEWYGDDPERTLWTQLRDEFDKEADKIGVTAWEREPRFRTYDDWRTGATVCEWIGEWKHA